jgi:hypothetical protein
LRKEEFKAYFCATEVFGIIKAELLNFELIFTVLDYTFVDYFYFKEELSPKSSQMFGIQITSDSDEIFDFKERREFNQETY